MTIYRPSQKILTPAKLLLLDILQPGGDYDSFVRSLQPTLWLRLNETSGSIAKNAAYSGGVGAELLTNGDFSAWTADDPDGWTVVGESGSDPEITERDSGQAHADTKTVGGSASFYSSATNNQPRASQTILTAGDTYRGNLVISNITSGLVRMLAGSTTVFPNISLVATPGTYQGDQIADNTGLTILPPGTAPHDFTIDSASVKKVGELDAANTAATVGQAGAGGFANEAYSFNGTTSLLTIVDTHSYIKSATTQKWAFLAKANSLGEGGANGNFATWGATSGYPLRFASSNRLVGSVDLSTTDAQAVSDINEIQDCLTNWAWYFMDYDDADSLGNGRKIRLFKGINGTITQLTLGTDTAGVGTVVAPTTNLIIGNRSAADLTFDGLMDEAISIPGSLWTTAEMQQLITLRPA